ncbi:hypothetical protein BGZ75_007005 [Mortierella antarctica]|nr:hypothetical protein BGZ75_007005 [Mortierella antarctica]
MPQANALYELADSPTYEEITESLQEYRNERYPTVKAIYNSSQLHAKVQMGHRPTTVYSASPCRRL